MARAVFKFLTGDVNFLDYGGKWYRKVGKGRYHIIELLNFEDAMGEKHNGKLYNVSLSEVDLMSIPQSTKKQAIESCGPLDEDIPELALVEACHSYGANAPLDQWDGNNHRALMKLARQRSAELDDHTEHRKAMMRPVNAIGSTALEFMQGDMNSALNRRPGPTVAVMTPQKCPSNDPLAYMAGYMAGKAGGMLDEPREQLAEEYIKGYQMGVDVRLGNVERPDWVKG